MEQEAGVTRLPLVLVHETGRVGQPPPQCDRGMVRLQGPVSLQTLIASCRRLTSGPALAAAAC
jgi:hypothetical protein